MNEPVQRGGRMEVTFFPVRETNGTMKVLQIFRDAEETGQADDPANHLFHLCNALSQPLTGIPLVSDMLPHRSPQGAEDRYLRMLKKELNRIVICAGTLPK